MDIGDFDDPNAPPKYLFIKGVFLTDCKSVDQILEEHLLGDGTPNIDVKVYDKLPSLYVGLEKWPISVNLWCWYCCKPFDGVPIFLPKSIEANPDGGYAMTTEGCFSSFPCAMAYVDREYPKIKVNTEKKNMLKFLYNDMMGKPIIDIPSAPSKFEMTHFGGDMSSLDFDKTAAALLQAPLHPLLLLSNDEAANGEDDQSDAGQSDEEEASGSDADDGEDDQSDEEEASGSDTDDGEDDQSDEDEASGSDGD